MSLRVGVVQLALPCVSTIKEKETAATRVANLIHAAPPADIYVLPELAPVGYTELAFAAREYLAEDEYDAASVLCRDTLAEVARQRNAFVCYGTLGRRSTADGSGFAIRHVVLNNRGDVVVSYDKCHLCDFGECAETRFFTPGKKLAFFECFDWRVGILICSDMRYTELSRELAVGRGCDLLIHPVAFARDVSFASWKSFVECRALENQVYWASTNYAGRHFGGSMWCPPWVDGEIATVSRLGTDEEIQVFVASHADLEKARGEFAFRRLRRNRTDYLDPDNKGQKTCVVPDSRPLKSMRTE